MKKVITVKEAREKRDRDLNKGIKYPLGGNREIALAVAGAVLYAAPRSRRRLSKNLQAEIDRVNAKYKLGILQPGC